MTADLITPDNVSTELLRSIFDSALFSTELDSDGDLHVRDGGIGAFVIPAKNNRHIHVASLFGAKDSSQMAQRYVFANRVNDQVIVVRTAVTNSGNFCFDHYIIIEGGVTPKNIVLATRGFLRIVENAIRQHDTDDVVA